MPTFDSSQKILSGVPVGGIGAGKLEILPSGVWNAFTFLNNWSAPLSGNGQYPGVLGFHTGISVRPAGKGSRPSKSFLLQTVPVDGAPAVRSIRYSGSFPEALIEYRDARLGVEPSLRVSGAFVPGDADLSALPGARFSLKVHNPKSIPMEVSLIFIGRNVLGGWNVGRQNRVTDAGEWLHLDFAHADRMPRDARSGRLLFSFSKKGWETSFWECWNAVRENFQFHPKAVRLDAWKEFVRSGRLPNRRQSAEASGENREWCSAVSARAVIPAGGTREWFFTAAWHAPHAHEPSRYEKIFRRPEKTHEMLVANRRRLERSTRAFHGAVRSLPFPAWFNDALINSLYPFYSSTRFTGDGRFAFFEAPVACPLMGTVDVGFYGSIPLAWFFPDLSKRQLRQFADAQRRDGYVPHDLGRERLDRASDGTTPVRWKDLNPKYALMVWRDFAWSGGDRRFLRDLYPSVRRALDWTAAADLDGDGLPEHEGADQTFDLWDMRGPQAYTAGLYLAALAAGRRMARLLKDKPYEALCARRFQETAFSFERKLWNGRFFGPTCLVTQLAGQWYADLTGLGDLVDSRKVRVALETIRVRNARPTRYGWVNSVLADGRLDTANNHTKNVWIGMNCAYVSSALMRGYAPNKLLKPLERLWDNLIWRQCNPWNQPDMIDAKTGQFIFGDGYYRNMAIWSIPIGLSNRNAAIARTLGRLKRAFGQGRA